MCPGLSARQETQSLAPLVLLVLLALSEPPERQGLSDLLVLPVPLENQSWDRKESQEHRVSRDRKAPKALLVQPGACPAQADSALERLPSTHQVVR
jgi:hypothetical protein